MHVMVYQFVEMCCTISNKELDNSVDFASDC